MSLTFLELEYVREVDAAPAVVLWNYWDHEHVTVVHKNYSAAHVLYEDSRTCVDFTALRLPFLGFLLSHNIVTTVLLENGPRYAFRVMTMGLLGLPFIGTVEIDPAGPDRSRVRVGYRIPLEGWHAALRPLLKAMARRWHERFWDEDLPIRLRRQKVLRLGFKDFVGLPDRVEDRRYDGPLETALPVARPPTSPVSAWLSRD